MLWPWEDGFDPRRSNEVGVGAPPPASPVDALIDKAMAESYATGEGGETSTGWKHWKRFTDQRGLATDRPLDPNSSLQMKLNEEWICMQFVCSLVEDRHVQGKTAAGYFSTVQGVHALRNGVKLAGGLKLARLPKMLKGLRRIFGDVPQQHRRGIAGQALRRAMDLVLSRSNPLHANIRAALSVAFQGLLRSAEYCATASAKAREVSTEKLLKRLPSRADIASIDEHKLVLMMCPCKNMRHLNGKTVPLVIGAGGEYVDAVAEVKNLLLVDPTPSGAGATTSLFRDPSTGRPLSYETMQRIVKVLMAKIGENPDDFGTHSLRIGGATALFAAGATPTVIRTMGRWSSDCYRLYVRACYEASIAWTKKAGSTVVTDIAQDFDEVDDY